MQTQDKQDTRGHNEMNTTITAQQLADARSRARLKQRELAELIQHSERAIQQWEINGVPAAKVALVRSVLGAHLEGSGNPLAQYSNMALLAELAKRLDAGQNN